MTGIILAGGQSRRMKKDKAFLQLRGKAMIDYTLDVLNSLCNEIILVTNSPEKFTGKQAQIVPDMVRAKGPLAGLLSGLCAAHQDRCLLTACDMPFVKAELLSYMACKKGFDAVVPYVNSRCQPFPGIYSRACIPSIQMCINQRKLRFIDLFTEIRVKLITEEEIRLIDRDAVSFININTPADYHVWNSIGLPDNNRI